MVPGGSLRFTADLPRFIAPFSGVSMRFPRPVTRFPLAAAHLRPISAPSTPRAAPSRRVVPTERLRSRRECDERA